MCAPLYRIKQEKMTGEVSSTMKKRKQTKRLQRSVYYVTIFSPENSYNHEILFCSIFMGMKFYNRFRFFAVVEKKTFAEPPTKREMFRSVFISYFCNIIFVLN